MPATLAILWNETLVGLAGTATRGALRGEASFDLRWPAGMEGGQRPAEAGEWLRSELNRLGVAARSVIVVLPRNAVVLRRLDLPNAPDEELPDLVRFQAATASSAPLERQLLDYFPLSSASSHAGGDDAPGRAVLAATVFRERVEAIRATLAAAGCELLSVVLAPAAIAEWIGRLETQRGDDRSQTSLTVVRDGDRLDAVATRGGRIVLAQSAELHDAAGDAAEPRVAAELSRMLVSLEAHGGSARIDRVWSVGLSPAQRSALAQRLQCPAREAEFAPGGPFAAPADAKLPPARFAPVVGALLGLEQRTVDAVDFLAPRRPPVQRDRTRERRLIAAAVVVLAIGLGWWLLHSNRNDLERRLAALRLKDEGLTAVVKRTEPTLAAVAIVDGWHDRSRDWLDVYRQIERLSPGTDSLYLTDVRAVPANGAAVARLRLTGAARQREIADRFAQKLAENRTQYRVDRLDHRFGAKDAEYPSWFEMHVDLLLQVAEDENKTR